MKDEGGGMKVELAKKRCSGQCRKKSRPCSYFILHPSSFILAITLIISIVGVTSSQTQRRSGAHSSRNREAFSSADRLIVDRAIGVTCAERVRDPFVRAAARELRAEAASL